VDAQRGRRRVFGKKHFRAPETQCAGYGTRWSLNLVHNPPGPQLPGPQAELEAE